MGQRQWLVIYHMHATQIRYEVWPNSYVAILFAYQLIAHKLTILKHQKKTKTKFEQNMKQQYRVHVYGTMNCIDFCAIIFFLNVHHRKILNRYTFVFVYLQH